jgi:hypothetical protein
MESTVKYSENLVLLEKGGSSGKTFDKKNLVLKTKKKIEDEETIEEMEKFLYSKETLEMDLKIISNQLLRDEINQEADKEKEENDPAYELNYAKKYLDITTVGGTFGNMPKVISIEGDPKKLQKKLRREEKIKKEKEVKMQINNEDLKKTSNQKSKKEIKANNEDFDFNKEIRNQQILKNNKDDKDDIRKELKEKLDILDDSSEIEADDEDKEENDLNDIDAERKLEGMCEKDANKLRKKMLKEEKREKRKLKKEIKLAFKVKNLNLIIICLFIHL